MKFSVLALDYDGTIATNDLLDPEVRRAISDLHEQGTLTILVTGRIYSDLERVAGDLQAFDAVVAENGGVLVLPDGRRQVMLGPRPPQELLTELRRLQVPMKVGSSTVEIDAIHAEDVLGVIRSLELPLVEVFNRGRMMILPEGISKATGLHAALRLFRASEHNAIGIGDAENDHTLLRACELGLAVEWGSPLLQAGADDVIRGSGPRAVAGYLRRVAGLHRLPTPTGNRHRLSLGHTASGEPVNLAVEGRNLLIVGDSHSGKSWIAGLLCEQLTLQRYSVCVVDPEGDYRGLEQLPGVVALGGRTAPPPIHEIALALRHPDLSVVVDLSKVPPVDKRPYVAELLPHLAALRQRTGLPHRIIVDEAHHFLNGPAAHALLDVELEGYTLITYRLADLEPKIAAACAALIATRVSDPAELRALFELNGACGDFGDWSRVLGGLTTREAVLLPATREASGCLCRFDLESRLTTHVRHREKYADVAVPDRLAFVFTAHGRQTGPPARTLRELANRLEEVSDDAMKGHLEREDFSGWITNVFADPVLADRVRMLERGFGYEAMSDVRHALCQLIEERYVTPAAA